MHEYLTENEVREKFEYQRPVEETVSEKIKNAVKCDSACLKSFIFGFFPILTWLPNYSLRKHLPGDIIGGVTTAIVRIPQSLAYGLLARVDPINGMYTAFFSPLVYTFLGTSSHISVGTFAVISLMLGSAVEKFLLANPFIAATTNTTIVGAVTMTDTTLFSTTTADPNANTLERNPEEAAYKLAIVGSITLLVGLIQIVMGIFNMGFVALFLSDPLISGFTTGAAVYVFSAQIKYFFGIDLHRHSAPFSLAKLYYELFTRFHETKPAEVIISVLTIVALYPIKLINVKYKKQLRSIPIPMELVIVIIATIVSANVDLKELYDVEVVGTIPSGLPEPTFPKVTYWPDVISDAFSIAIVSFAITVSIGKLFAKKHGYKISANQELFALGVSQLSCAFFQGHACSGSLARSSVKESSGTKTQFSDVVSCVVILLVLLFVGPLLEPLPVACLSSIIMVNIRTLFHQFSRLPQLWKLCKYDFSVWIITFVATILLGVDMGLMVGVVSLLATVVLRKYNSSVTISGQFDQHPLYGDLELFDKAAEINGVRIIRLPDAPFFGNKEALEAISADVMAAKRKLSDKGTGRLKRPHRGSEQSQALLDESSESDSGVDEKQVGKFSEDETKANSADDFVVSVDAGTGAVRYESGSIKKSATDLASLHSRSLSDKNSSHSSSKSLSSWKPLPVHYFHSIVFDCTGWTFMDTMGIDLMKQICTEFQSLDIRVCLGGLSSKMFDKLSDAEFFSQDYSAVAYPTLQYAVAAAQVINLTPETEAGSSVDAQTEV